MILRYFLLLLLLLPAVYKAPAQQYRTTSADASFAVNAPAKTITGESHAVSVRIDLKQGSVQLKTKVQSFRFSNNFVADTLNQVVRDRFNSYYMESDRFPEIIYNARFSSSIRLKAGNGAPVAFRTEGKLLLHGVAQPAVAEGTLTPGKGSVTVRAHMRLQPATYGIRIPPYIGDMYFKEVEIVVEGTLNTF